MSWVRNKKVKTTLKMNEKNKVLFDLLEKANVRLKNNTYNNPIIKRDTASFGEIPADFGRK